jgi:hypothetical protein
MLDTRAVTLDGSEYEVVEEQVECAPVGTDVDGSALAPVALSIRDLIPSSSVCLCSRFGWVTM